ncbi:sodium:solute symporter family protein [Asticcacaulis biprosthecium C19]|uniref:Sodium:solute symporter family protein n=1 Tax=Asticcacaulis biprosthecium C19 TaxID=715226 RepID=F4QMX2_9CAUL|nr:sodium:solute symporter family protein [Asticcacaulis biprosthecium]EGF91563.1 sodium:solute symporter family protein [Asticcacaulis biprosthecium C19]
MTALHGIDIAIVAGYVLLTIGLGFWVAKLSSGNLSNYFLAGNKLPWWVLGLSNASGMFDVAGTMWMVGLLVVYGLKSVFIPWLWPVFNQIFLMMFLAIWLRRSGKLTGAEWITFRFGDGLGARASHLINVVFALIMVVGMLAFGFLGIGKLVAEFSPWKLAADPVLNDKLYGLIVVGLTTVYSVKGGMYSVVMTEILQFFIKLIVCIAIAWLAFTLVSPEALKAAIPDGWNKLAFGWNLDLDWARVAETAKPENRVVATSAIDTIAKEGHSYFAIFMGLMVFQGFFKAMAGPAPNYDMQRLLSAKSPTEAAKISGFVNLVLLFPRYLMIAGMAVLALVFIGPYWSQLQANAAAAGKPFVADFDAILPWVVHNYMPPGLLGIALAGLLSAFMATYSASLNAAPAYVVNDIYRKYIKPEADQKSLMRLSYLTSFLFAVIAAFIGWQLTSINDVVTWITTGLYGGYTVANVVKWYWWRLNGTGYAASMALGVVAAMWMAVYKDPVTGAAIDGLAAFPWLFAACLAVAVIGSLVTKPTDMETLKAFYKKTRPWGFWGPVLKALQEDEPAAQPNRDFGRDMFNCLVGVVWQTALTASAIFLMIREMDKFLITLAVIVVCTVVMKFTWWDRLRDEPA